MISSRLLSNLLAAMFLTGCGAATLPQAGLSGVAGAESSAAKGLAYKVAGQAKSKHWDKIEKLKDSYAKFPTELSRPNAKLTDPELVAAFGSALPPSNEVLLHFAEGWEKGEGTPVILVHGAIVEANSNWVTPHDKPGLMPALVAAKRRVFAVTFAHRHGDNVLQAQMLAHAIARVKAVTGAKEVDIVAHSKGTVSTRTLLSGVRKPWMTKYQGDVRRVVMIAGPHLGLDYPYRHPMINLALHPEKNNPLLNAPMSWNRMIAFGRWVDTSAQSIAPTGENYFPGQAQMLARFDQEFPLPKLEQDWYTTYHGGKGFISESEGIDKAIKSGGNFIDNLKSHPLDSGVQLAILAGDRPNLANVLNEKTGPSDGIVFVKSATASADMTRGGAKLIAKETMNLNHMDLIIDKQAHAWVLETLAKP